MIRNNFELERSYIQINKAMQEVQDYIGPDDLPQFSGEIYKIKFPSHYLRSASYFRSRLAFIEDIPLKKNISYCLIEADLLSWLLNRTNIVGSLREMIIKSGMIKMGSIAESCVWYFTKNTFGGNRKFITRCKSLQMQNIISEELEKHLVWLWNSRDAIHFFLIGEAEYRKYTDKDYDKAYLAVRELINVLNNAGK